MPSNFSLQELLSRARRRELTHLVLDKTALAAIIAMGGAILLLLLGTELLEWYWVALLAIVSLGVGLYSLRNSIPNLYTLAQRIDRRLKLADSLSTALYFGQHPDLARRTVCERQREDAELVAREVDLRQALPLARSKYAAPAAGLVLVALGLFGLRYLVTGTMSLEPSLVRIAYDSFFGGKPIEAKNQLKGIRPKLDPSVAGDGADAKSGDKERPPDDLNSPDNGESDDAAGKNPDDQGKGKSQDKGSDKGDANQKGDPAGNKDGADQAGAKGDSKSGDEKSGDPKNANQDSKGNSNSGNSSLMDKLRDALSNMMNKMKPQDGQQQSGNNSKQGQQGDKADKGQKSAQSKDQKSQASTTADAEGDQGDQTEADDATDSKKSSDKNASQDAKNGAGSQDGEKALREAEQLQAMGKISEVLGKRSASVSGEVMVEVGNSKQPLKTPWAQREATHTEAGSEIHRDEVPLIYQQFVQQYFEEIRKPAAAPNKASAK